MTIDHMRRYESADDFFNFEGNVVMKVSADAAIAVCKRAAKLGLVVARIEGGLWHAPGFEARLDCIWDGVYAPVDQGTAEKNNLAAADFIRAERAVHDAYVITVATYDGAVTSYVELLQNFLERGLSADQFQRAYLKKFKAQDGFLDERIFSILDELFGDIDSYTDDSVLLSRLDGWYLNETELRYKVERAQKKLLLLKLQN